MGEKKTIIGVFLQDGQVKKEMVNYDRDYIVIVKLKSVSIGKTPPMAKRLLSSRGHPVEGPVELAAPLDFVACG